MKFRAALVSTLLLVSACASSGESEAKLPPKSTTTSTVSQSIGFGEAVCENRAKVTDLGTLTTPEVTEASGLAASRVSPGIWWIHNDSGDTARIFAINEKGELRATVNIEGVSAVDWEDIAIETERGDDPDDSDVDTIYVGDIGDGQSKRDNIVVYAIESPKVAVDGPAPATLTAKARAITLTYPDGPHDAEALAYDPSEDELVIVTKDWSMAGVSGIYTADADGTGGVLEREGEFRSKPGTLVTGIDISPDGSLIAVRAYGAVDLFQRGEYADVAVALHSTPCIGPQINESQSEAIGFNADGSSYVTIAEGVGQTLHRTHG